MKKLVAMIAIVAVLFLTASAFANGNGPPGEIPLKPGTGSNPGLLWAATWGFYMSNGANLLGLLLTDWLWGNAPPFPWPPGK